MAVLGVHCVLLTVGLRSQIPCLCLGSAGWGGCRSGAECKPSMNETLGSIQHYAHPFRLALASADCLPGLMLVPGFPLCFFYSSFGPFCHMTGFWQFSASDLSEMLSQTVFTELFLSSIFSPLSSHWTWQQSWASLWKADTLPHALGVCLILRRLVLSFWEKVSVSRQKCGGHRTTVESVFSFHHGSGDLDLGCAPSTLLLNHLICPELFFILRRQMSLLYVSVALFVNFLETKDAFSKPQYIPVTLWTDFRVPPKLLHSVTVVKSAPVSWGSGWSFS